MRVELGAGIHSTIRFVMPVCHTGQAGEFVHNRTRGNDLAENHRRADGMPKKRVYRLNLRIDPDLDHALRREASTSGLSLSASARLATEDGLPDHSGRDDLR